MNRDLDVLTFLLLDPCLTTDEATREAAATPAPRPQPDRAAPAYPATKPIVGRERPRWAESAACE
jgi:hypothetical protein